MADDNSARYRPNEFGRGAASAAPASDPLAELARLIGQSDPFAEYAREPRPGAQPGPGTGYAGNGALSYDSIPAPPPYGSEPAPHFSEPVPPPQQYSDPAPPRYAEPAPQQYSDPAPRYAEPTPQYSDPAPRYADPAPHHSEPTPQYGQDHGYTAPAAPRYAADYPPRYAAAPAAHDDWPGSPAAAPSYAPSAPFVPPHQQYAPPQQPPHYDNQGYGAPNFASQPYADPRAGFGPAGFPATPDRQGFPPPLYPAEPEAGGMPPPHDDEFYDDEPRGGRRKGLLTVLAVLGLAVVGTAGAFGYRSIFGGPGSSGPPPVIRASGEPSKVAPPSAATPDTSASKFSYDRFGDAGKDEQVVRREEKPVDLSKTTPPRTVFPGAPVPNTQVAKQSGNATTAAANPPSAIGEPRRVRTVPIRPDQGGDAVSTAPSQQPMAVIPRQANANAAATADDPPPRAAAQRAPAAPRPARSAPSQAAIPSANAPLSLSPEANNAPPQSVQDSFPPPPPRAAAPPTRVATAPASGGGSYLVQVSSQKSEADAESAYRSIRSKYSSVIGSHPHQVRRADLGSRGVYYRAMVGPFGSREEAVQVCSSLKQAGGDCVVQH